MVKLFRRKDKKPKENEGKNEETYGLMPDDDVVNLASDAPTTTVTRTVQHIPPPQQQHRHSQQQHRQTQQYRQSQPQQPPPQEYTMEAPVAPAPPSPQPKQRRASAPKAKPTPPPQPTSSTPMTAAVPEENAHMSLEQQAARASVTRELVKKFVADIWNRGDIEMIEDVCSKNLRFNGSVGLDRVGHDGFAKMVTTIRESLSDYHCEIHSMVVEGNKAFCRMRFTGRHTGNLLGYPPTNRVVAWMGASEFTMKGSKIVKVWELGDVKSLEDQLKAPMEG